ncbi:MAG: Asp-tRNA(Asn)/Glu-tRNA(Gln) amidotransferase subunit GatA [Cytophagales bacterium]
MRNYNKLSDIQSEIASGTLSCVKLVEHYLKNIQNNKHLNAFIEVYDEEARTQAEKIDQKIKNNQQGKLAGMVIGLKDVLCHKDHKLQASSKILDGFTSQFSGTAIQRLIDEDAIIIGRQSCDEFAMGSSNENSCFGPVRNAADPEKVPGGSSGASAVAVQADMCQASIGSDTGGSVRQPAAFCGVIGLKPTYSRISRFGLIAYGSSFDCIGPITKSVEDAALLLEVMAGADDFDSTVSQKPVDVYSKSLDSLDGKKLKIGYLKDALESAAIQPEIKESFQHCLDSLKDSGHEVSAIDLPYMDKFLPVYYILTTAEASTNLSRYDGVRYGFRSPNTKDLESMYKKTREEGFGKEVKKRIMLGTFVLSASYVDAFYNKAQKVRRLIKESTEKLLSNHDFLLMPTTPTTAFKIGEKTTDPLEMYLADIFTVHANLAGVPAISLPVGHDKNNMPIGVQVIGNYFNEAKLLAFAHNMMVNSELSLDAKK